jgi:hypothetical protein
MLFHSDLDGKLLAHPFSASRPKRLCLSGIVQKASNGLRKRQWIAKNAKRRNGMQAAYQARKQVHPLSRTELDAITEVWVEAAFRLQDRDRLEGLLRALLAERANRGPLKPLLVKIAPDLDPEAEAAIAEVALALGIDGLIVGNTTVARPRGLRSRHRAEAGGLSGRPLFGPSTEQLRRLRRLTGGRLILVGVGGVASGADAYAKIQAGASLVQLYTAMIYQGPGIVRRLCAELDDLLARDGFATVSEADLPSHDGLERVGGSRVVGDVKLPARTEHPP